MTQTAYMHVCDTFAKLGQCRCFDDVVNTVSADGRWWYWHCGVFTEGKGEAPPLGERVLLQEQT